MIDPTLNVAALATVERAINVALAMDVGTQNRLRELDDNCFLIECTEPPFKIHVLVDGNSIRLPSVYDITPTSHLTGTLSEFVELAIAADKPSALINSGSRLAGDSAPLIKLAEILADIELDWEAQLAKLLGDVPAHFIGESSRHFFRFGKRVQQTFLRHLEEYLHEEARLLPTKLEVDDYLNDVKKLTHDVDRCEARIKRLQQQLLQQQDNNSQQQQPTAKQVSP